MAVGIAGAVTAATVAVLGITGAIVTYVASNYQHLTAFYIIVSLSALAFVIGIWQGTRGIAEVTNRGFTGHWTTETRKHRFDKQAAFILGGLVLLGVAMVVGFTSKAKAPTPPRVSVTVTENKSVTDQFVKDEVRITQVITGLTTVIRDLELRIEGESD
jgi:hypothetical protein